MGAQHMTLAKFLTHQFFIDAIDSPGTARISDVYIIIAKDKVGNQI